MSEQNFISRSEAFKSVLEMAQKAALSNANVLITGESGTGKEVMARYIHEESHRQQSIFVPLNCSAIPEQLLESELFGYVKGAFTGALGSKVGLFEEANGGTLFLDEIGDMNLSLQAKILRVLQERKIKRVGENTYRKLNIRIVAATHNDLAESVGNKSFREDLYFRLNVVRLHIPSLRSRREDIIPLADFFLQKFVVQHRVGPKELSSQAQDFLIAHHWPGNVRELENAVERAVILSRDTILQAEDFLQGNLIPPMDVQALFDRISQQENRLLSLEEMTQLYIDFVLAKNGGAREKTAKDLGIDRKTLYRRIKSLRTVGSLPLDPLQ